MFETLLKTAIIGTTNGAQVPEIDMNEIALPENISQEEKILLAAAFYTFQEKASYQATTYTQELPAACPEEEQLYAPLSVCELMLRCMSKEQEDSIVVREILEKMEAKKWIAMPYLLPKLLEYGQNRTILHSLISKVSGKRGKWLVSYNKTWKYILVEANDAADWDTGTHEERLNYFRLRHKSHPAEAIALLQQDWHTEALKNKKEFMTVLAEQPNAVDEAFLAPILAEEQEKDNDLRRKMAEVLAQIPNSACLQALEKQVSDCFKMKAGFLSVEKLQITAPITPTPALQKVGIVAVKAGNESGKQGILAQLLTIFPPTLLAQQLKKTPEALWVLVEKTTFNEVILASLTQAAILHKDEMWLSALIFAQMAQKKISPEMKKMQNILSTESYGNLVEKVAKTVKDKALLFFLANREITWAETETKIALTEMQNAIRRYANARPWDCNDFKDIAKTVSIYVQAAQLKPFSDILHQMSVSREWEKELKSCVNRIDLRIQIAMILS